MRLLSHLAALLVLLAGHARLNAKATVLSVRDFGAHGDGVTLDTSALQQAIDRAHREGGGIVRIEGGRFLSGSLTLKSGVTLEIARDAVLLGSPRIADYRRGKWPALLLARDAERIAVIGEGTIDGQGKLVAADTVRIWDSGNLVEFFPETKPGDTVNLGSDYFAPTVINPYALQRAGKLAEIVAPPPETDLRIWRVYESVRPQLIEFTRCRGVEVRGVKLQHAANWVQSYRECDDLTIAGVRVDSTTYWNNDGMDIVNCHRVRIEDCDIDAADDGICLKSEPNAHDRGCEDITIARCRLRTSASAIKFGTASHHGFRRVRIEDVDVRDTYRTAIALETVDGGVLEDIAVRRVKARHSGGALFLRIGQRNTAKPPGILRRVLLEDFDVEVAAGKPDAGYPHDGPLPLVPMNVLPSSIVGLPDRAIEDVTLRNIRITYRGRADRQRAEVPLARLSAIPEHRANYPEFSMFGELPAWALFVRHASNIRLENVEFRLNGSDFRGAIVADRSRGIHLRDVTISENGGSPAVAFSECVDVTQTQMRLPGKDEPVFLSGRR